MEMFLLLSVPSPASTAVPWHASMGAMGNVVHSELVALHGNSDLAVAPPTSDATTLSLTLLLPVSSYASTEVPLCDMRDGVVGYLLISCKLEALSGSSLASEAMTLPLTTAALWPRGTAVASLMDDVMPQPAAMMRWR